MYGSSKGHGKGKGRSNTAKGKGRGNTAKGHGRARGAAQMAVQAKLNQHHIDFQPGQQRLHVDTEAAAPRGLLRFERADADRLLVDIDKFGVQKELFVLTPAGANGSSGRDVISEALEASIVEEFDRFLDEELAGLPPARSRVKLEVRLGALMFHSFQDEAKGQFTRDHFESLARFKDYKTQFKGNLKVAQLEEQFRQLGFDYMDSTCRTNVRVVCARGGSYTVTFVDHDDGEDRSVDPRATPAKRHELERIAKCTTFEEVLEVDPTASQAVVKKALHRKSLLVHPDKNAFEGATEAMKVLMEATDALTQQQPRRRRLTPPLFAVAPPEKDPPKIIDFVEAKRRHSTQDVVKLGCGLDYRVAVTSKAPAEDAAARGFLELAWKEGSIEEGGSLKASREYSIDTVRFKDTRLLSDGETMIELSSVRQKSLGEGGGQFRSSPEADISSPALTDFLAELQGRGPPSDSDKARAQELFRALIRKGNMLAARLS